MRLFELIDTKFKNTSTNDKHFPVSRNDIATTTYDKEHPTTGQYGYVVPDEEDPHQIIKKYKRAIPRKDSYLTYIEEITKNKLSSENPFFPRVYDVERQTDVMQRIKPTFKMEKLINSADLDENIMYRMGKSLFNNFKEIRSKNKDTTSRDLMATILNDMLASGNFNECKNPYLKSALEFIFKIIQDNQKYDFFPDLHANNYMIRPTPHGPQLVLIDPIGG